MEGNQVVDSAFTEVIVEQIAHLFIFYASIKCFNTTTKTVVICAKIVVKFNVSIIAEQAEETFIDLEINVTRKVDECSL